MSPLPAPGPGCGVELDRDGPVATVTLRRPDVLAARVPAVRAELYRYGRDLSGDVRVVVVRGETGAFAATDRDCDAPSGAPDGPSGARPPSPDAPGLQQPPGDLDWLRRPDIVSIAAVRGPASGLALHLALACDLRFLAEDARLVMPEVGLGTVPDLGATKRLVELVGYARALELCVTGRPVSATEAERIGLANAVVPDLDAATIALTRTLLAADRDATVEVKALLAAAGRASYREHAVAEREALERLCGDRGGG